jgi:hypothetical protein
MNDASSTTITDSTGNGHTATKDNSSNVTQSDGAFGSASQDCSTLSDGLVIPYSASLIPGSSDFTMSIWAKLPNSSANLGFGRLFSYQDGTPFFFMRRNSTSNYMDFDIRNSSSVRLKNDPSVTIFDNNWHSLQMVLDDTTNRAYKNGSSIGTSTTSTFGAINDAGNDESLGIASSSVVGTRGVEGLVDEARIIMSALPADWITTEHNNQNDNAAFWVATEVETATASPIAHILQMI